MNQFKSFGSSGLIDFLRDSTEAALDLSKNLTAAQSPAELVSIWTKFAEGQYTAAQRYGYQLTAETLPTTDVFAIAKQHAPMTAISKNPDTGKGLDAGKEQENAALISELENDIETLTAKLAALTEQVVALQGQTPKVKFSFGEPPHTGWTPSKVVVLGNDEHGHLVELPSTIEPGGFRYVGAPSFWIAIG
jgi:Phasin protein